MTDLANMLQTVDGVTKLKVDHDFDGGIAVALVSCCTAINAAARAGVITTEQAITLKQRMGEYVESTIEQADVVVDEPESEGGETD